MKKTIVTIVILLSVFRSLAQQDPQYNLYQFNPLLINPAFAGARDALQVIASHRQQWLSFPGAPVTTCFTLHSPLFNRKLGAGLTIINDEIGPRNVFSAYGNLAYILQLSSKLKLNFGVNAGYNRYQFRFSEVKFHDVEAPTELRHNITPGTMDINAGLFLHGSGFFAGISASHLNNPSVYTYEPVSANSDKFTYRLRTHLFISGGYSFLLSNKAVFAPTVLFKQIGEIYTMDVNLNFLLYKKFWIGGFYRYSYGVGGLFQYLVNDRFKVGYSYDTGLQSSGRLGGSHEIMIGFDYMVKKSQYINPRFL